MPSKTELVTIRPFEAGDKNFILATWLRGLYYGDTWFKEIPKDIFMASYHKFLEHRLADPTLLIAIACLREDPEVILGYSVSRPGEILDWVFIKQAWRRIGLAKMLVPSNVQTVTHLTRPGLSILRAKLPAAVFNPFI